MTKAFPVPDRISEMAMFGAPLQMDPKSEAGGLLEIIERVHARRRQFDGESREIAADPHLSEIGKRQRLVSLAEAALRDVGLIADGNAGGNLRETLDAIRRRAGKLEAKINSRPTEDTAAAAVRQVFLWERLERVDVLERPGLFFGAIESGDSATYFAFLDAPALLNLLPSDVLERGVALWNEQRDPATAKAVADLRTVADRLEATARETRAHIESAAGFDSADATLTAVSGRSA